VFHLLRIPAGHRPGKPPARTHPECRRNPEEEEELAVSDPFYETPFRPKCFQTNFYLGIKDKINPKVINRNLFNSTGHFNVSKKQ
jgi:hypothetical protein